ncbi:succinate dehydrogenase/fumarate reductase iron-sulfur subunit [Myxococcota bacterium]|nr:succinate dehydrogenase/fumarate reductase iron-sulfur subunit [Myxococcota bacterium]
MNVKLRIWRQNGPNEKGKLVDYEVSAPEDASFLEGLDILNESLINDGKEPVAFDHDCREGICGACSLVINGVAHGDDKGITTCQLHMRHFSDGDTIIVEPFKAKAFPIIRDLVTDRTAFDRIIQSGGFISVGTGNPQDANAIQIPRADSETAFDAAACIGCGACVAACKNASAMLFLSAKVSHLAHLPQGQPERKLRPEAMLKTMEAEGFGACTNTYECEAVCPKEISANVIGDMNRDFWSAKLRS